MARRTKDERTCDRGHVQEETWEHCPFCEAEQRDQAAKRVSRRVVSTADATPDPGDGAVVIARRETGRRPLAGWLVVLQGEDEGEDFRVEVGRNSIGKGADCDVMVRDPYVSERHAILEIKEDGSLTLRDLDSKHGTFVDESRVHGERPLRCGDDVRVGHTELRYRAFRDKS